jgi:hypothetical protein
MSPHMSIDYYAQTRQIIDALAAEGLSSDGDALRDAIAAGSTGTEILMAVRWHLQQVDRSNKTSNVVTKRMIRELLDQLESLLS